MFKIEKGIPLPPKVTNPQGASCGVRNRNNLSYPLAQLEVGDSFAVPLTDEFTSQGAPRATSRVAMAAAAVAKTHGFKFTLRTLRDQGVVRCWRIS